MKFKLIILAGMISAFVLGYGAVAHAWPIYGRNANQGYFLGGTDTSGTNIFPTNSNTAGCAAASPNAIPDWVNSAASFIGFIECKLNSNNGTTLVRNQERTGAAFIIQTMIGNSTSRPPSAAQIAEWESRVYQAQNVGGVNWAVGYGYNINSYYQGTNGGGSDPNDDAFYNNSGSANSIVFWDYTGTIIYAIRRPCANPVGNGNLYPLIGSWSAAGSTTISDGVPDAGDTTTFITTRPGDTVSYTHTIQNGPTSSNGFDISYSRYSYAGSAGGTWTAQYYNNKTLTGAPVLTQTEPYIAYNYGAGGPGGGVATDNFSARWTKTDTFAAGTYDFTAISDDGSRVYVDGSLIINAWADQSQTSRTAQRVLSAGPHTIIVEYYDSTAGAFIRFDYTNNIAQAGTSSGTYAANQAKTFNASFVVPAGAPSGTMYCERILWNWKNSQAAGDIGWGTAGMGYAACAVVASSNYDLTPNVSASITSGGSPIAGNMAEQGDVITFTYSVNNSQSGASSGTSCTIYGTTKVGYYTIPTPYDSTSDVGFVQPAHGCPRNFPGSTNTTLVTEVVNATQNNRSICRSLFVSPPSGASATPLGAEACVYVVLKPYLRTFSGDVKVGGDFTSSGSCSSSNSSVVGWNRNSAGGYAGAGSQFATLALGNIVDFATSINAQGITPPSSLAFANTSTNAAAGLFGGGFGSVPCIPDYYGGLASVTATPLPANPNIGSLASGTYSHTGDVTITGGALPAGKRITIYVTGEAFIENNITYSGSWTYDTTPQFRLIVNGNLIIDNDLTQLDGLYVAQGTTATTGILRTCGNGPLHIVPLDGTLRDNCNNIKLVVNGSLVGRQILPLRSLGSLSQSAVAEAATSGWSAEAIVLNPALWIYQPPSTQQTEYDAITTLPPVL